MRRLPVTMQNTHPAAIGDGAEDLVQRTFRASQVMPLEPTTPADRELQETVLAEWEAQHHRLLAEGWQIDTYNEPRRPGQGTWFKYATYERRTR